MKLEQLHQIIEIDKYGSISKAAKAMYMGRPALSNALSNLEEEVGAVLFERDISGVVPTEEGKEVLRLAKQMVECEEQILNLMKQERDLCGNVVFGITQAFSFLFSDIILEFKRKYPKANLTLKVSSPEKLVEGLVDGNINIGLTLWEQLPEQTAEALYKKNLACETFGCQRIVLYVSKDSMFANREYVSLEELRQEKFVAFSERDWLATNRYLKTEQLPFIMEDRENLKRIVSLGEAIAALPDSLAIHDRYCEQGLIQLISIEESDGFNTGTVYLLHPAKRKLTLLEIRVQELVRELLKNVY